MLGLEICLLVSLAHNVALSHSIYGTIEISESKGEFSDNIQGGLGILETQWEKFLEKHDKNYDESEKMFRFEIFKDNSAKINVHNKLYYKGKVSYEMETNKFTDMTFEEIRTLYLGFNYKHSEKANKMFYNEYIPNVNIDVAAQVDWRTKNVVTPVKNQGTCGSCYSFSATGSMEGQYALKNNKLISLSEQNIIDCSMEFGNYGCGGGLMEFCFNYVKSNKGIDTEQMYPYEGTDAGKCRYQNNPFELISYKNIQSENETALMNAVAEIGPISVGIDAEDDFVAYTGGIYSSKLCSPQKLNHGVLVVGYGVESGKDYWLVKNSWGPTWGMQGYIKMARNQNNMCGIASSASFPIL